MRRLWHFLYVVTVTACVGVFGAVGYLQTAMPDHYTVTAGNTLRVSGVVESAIQKDDRASLRLFGLFPIKDVEVAVTDTPHVTVCGIPFGIKLYTDGVLVVRLADVQTAAGDANPAAAAGICVGDTILSVEGTAVSTNEEVAALISGCGGRAVTLRVRRDGLEFPVTFVPARAADGSGYRAGMWVRDSTAGVGMLTFYDAATGVYAGLGHAVCDADTGGILSVSSGEIVPARIHGVERGAVGAPGELKGSFETGTYGDLRKNGEDGLYGVLTRSPTQGVTMPLAMRQEVHAGAAQILTTVDDGEPQWYDIEIEQVRRNASAVTRHMIVRITDERLLAATGGIVQGMSGSPVVQNGKLIGAVTHVLVDDPTKGYGIFAENMLETAQQVADEKALKDAS